MPKQVIAVTDISVAVQPGMRATDKTPAKKPVLKTIKAGTWFVPQDDAQEKEFVALGAVRYPDSKEKPGTNFAEMPIREETGRPQAKPEKPTAAEAAAATEAAEEAAADAVAAEEVEAAAKPASRGRGRGRKDDDLI